jgi:Ni/Co efflux regulator RcnB
LVNDLEQIRPLMVFTTRDGGIFMKSILLSGAAAALLLTASGAFAAPGDDQHQSDNHPDAGAHAGSDNHMSGPADNHGAMGDHGATGMTGHNGHAGTTVHRARTRHTRTTHTNTMRAGDHTNVNVHVNVDLTKYRRAETATHHFHAGDYRAPVGYAYRRYNIGERLEPAFYARDYWLADYATYALMAPPDGYTWVRFGPDAMLIDENTGEVIQVQYGIFD